MLSESLFNLLTKTLKKSFNYEEEVYHSNVGKLFYLHHKQSYKPTLVLIHGFSDIPENLIRSTFFLRNKFNIILPALKGFDQEGVNPHINYSLDLYADQILSLIESLGIKKFVVGGNSLGGATAVKIYEKAPEKIQKLILMDSAGFEYNDVDSVFKKIKSGQSNPFLINNKKDFNNLFDQLFYRIPKETYPVKNYFFKKYKYSKDDYIKLTEKLFVGHEDRNFIVHPENIKTKTLIVWGEHDGFFPSEVAKLIHDQVPHSTLELIPKVGHLPHIEKPLKLAKILRNFLGDEVLTVKQ